MGTQHMGFVASLLVLATLLGAQPGFAAGDVTVWSTDDFKPMQVPPVAQHNVAAIASMENNFGHLTLLKNGTVVVWGGLKQITKVPKNATKNVVAVAAGFNFGLVLYANGSVAALTDIPNPIPLGKGTYNKWMQVPPAARTGVKAISIGAEGLCVALKTNGQLVAWGEVNLGPVPKGVQGRVVSIAAGKNVVLLQLSSGKLVAWSRDPFTQKAMPDPIVKEGVVAVSCGGSSANGWCAAWLKGSGRILQWWPGNTGIGSSGRYPLVPANSGKPQPKGKAIKALSIGTWVGAVMLQDGTVQPWYLSSVKPLSFANKVKSAIGIAALDNSFAVITTPKRV